MEALRLCLSEREKEKYHTHTDSTHGLRPGMFLLCSTLVYLTLSYSAEIVKWVAQSMRPFSIVEDDGFKTLMKTGRPEYYLPSRITVARDVKQVFQKSKKRISRMLQVSSMDSQ